MIKEFDLIFYIYVLLTIFMLTMIFLILKKSKSTVNYLFSLTPLTFSIVLILNLVEYWYDVANIIPRIPYMLASMGVFYAGIYIFEGNAMKTDFRIILFTFVFTIYAFVISIYLELLDLDNMENPTATGIMHMSIGIPIFLSLYHYNKVKELVPTQSRSINFLLAGSLLVILGALIRGMTYVITQKTNDSIPGLITILVGAMVIILSFTSITGNTQSAKQ